VRLCIRIFRKRAGRGSAPAFTAARSTRQRRGRLAADDDLALLVDRREFAIDELFPVNLALASDPGRAGEHVARPEPRDKPDAQPPQGSVAQPIGQQPRAETARQHAHAEHRLVAVRLRIDLVMMVGIEVVRGAGVAHELGARERPADERRRRVAGL
jgi:hypothetical protein